MTAQHILICMHDFARGGTERVAIVLARLWVEAGRNVTILCGNEEGGLRDIVDWRVAVEALDPPVRRSPMARLRLGRAMGRELARLRPDVIFLPGNYHSLLAPGLRKADAGTRLVLKISNPALPRGMAAGPARFFFRRVTSAVDGFAAMNGGLSRELQELHPAKRVVTLYDPMEMAASAPVPRQAGPYRVGWVGRLEPQKDAMLALRVIQALNAIVPAHLTLLGEGSLARQVDGAIERLGLRESVTRVGRLDNVAGFLAATDALLITSRYEGGPAVAVEALAMGVPVVSTDCSHLLREIVTIPQAGRIVPSREPRALAAALAQLLRQPPAPRDALSALVAGFAPQVCAQAYLNFFDTLAGHDG